MISRNMDDGSLGRDQLEQLQELFIVGSIIGVQIIGNIAIDNNQMDLLFSEHLIQIFGNRRHNVDVLLDVSPICKRNHLRIPVFGPRID